MSRMKGQGPARRGRHVMILAACVCFLLNLTACQGQALPAARKFSEYRLISVMGLDESQDMPGQVALTLSAKEQSDSKLGGGMSGAGGEAGDRPLLLTNEAGSIALAYQQMQTYTQDFLFLGHVRYCLLGEQAARTGLSRYLDYLCRDPDGRYLARLYVVEDATARDMMSKASTNMNYLADRLNAMESDVGVLSATHALNLAQVAGLMEGARGNLLLPLLKLVEPAAHDATAGKQKESKDDMKDKKDGDGQKDASEDKENAAPDGPDGLSRDLDIAGYAVIIHGRMAGSIDTGLSPAVNFLQNTVHTQLVEVDAGGGQIAALRVLNSHSDLRPRWDGDRLTGLDITVEVEAALNETQSGRSFTGGDQLKPLAAQLEDWIEARVTTVLSQMQTLGADTLGLGARIEKRHPVRFSKIEDDWDQLFTTLPVVVRVEASVIRSYEIN